MEYRKGTIGRVFSVRFDEGDFFLEEFIQLIKKENIRAGWFHVLGGLREADVVTGPKEPTMPPEPVWSEVRGAREVLGTGRMEDILKLLEVMIIELKGIEATRPWYEIGGFNRLTYA